MVSTFSSSASTSVANFLKGTDRPKEALKNAIDGQLQVSRELFRIVKTLANVQQDLSPEKQAEILKISESLLEQANVLVRNAKQLAESI